jgi:hypothetical protein
MSVELSAGLADCVRFCGHFFRLDDFFDDNRDVPGEGLSLGAAGSFLLFAFVPLLLFGCFYGWSLIFPSPVVEGGQLKVPFSSLFEAIQKPILS